jgi:hypothetical protein
MPLTQWAYSGLVRVPITTTTDRWGATRPSAPAALNVHLAGRG